ATFGEDADYAIHLPGFWLHADGTVTDSVTGLMWQKGDGGEMTYENAEAYCANLTLGGHDDWRLPTAQEAFSILHHGKAPPALDPATFATTPAEYWWTSERQVGNASKVWVSNAGGGIGNHLKTETLSAGGTKRFHVRAVRDVQPPRSVAQRFTPLLNTVIDSLTGLEWQRFIVPTLQDSMTWEAALAYAENLVLAGKSDWRLPNIKEMQSLNDETLSQPSLNTSVFPGIGICKFWSSTTLYNQPARAWYLDSRFGITTYDLKTARNYFLCVRGPWQTSATEDLAATPAPQVSPNPFSSRFRVLTDEADAWYELRDCTGRPVYAGPAPDQQDFSTLPAGFYALTLHGHRRSASVRLLKL
ncbi:MAG TPA: DUF1566 domain-containing protein, partial [Saprospiraceae bacterium]|nr:DUF1566 domain-containing protein [Saprospiraceae bacterium]